MRNVAVAFMITLLFTGLGCVIRTEHRIEAHITLDIRHVEEAVGGVFDYVEGTTEELPEITAQSTDEPTSWLRQVGDMLSPIRTAYAAESETSPLIEEIAESMKNRYPELAKWKAKGCLGENNKGYVELRDCEEAKDPQKKEEILKVVNEENKDRKALYKELARLKGLDLVTLERVGAKDKLKRARKGEWVQLPEAGKDFDEFKTSDPGKNLGDKCQPKAWVQMP